MPERIVAHRLEQRDDLFGLPSDGNVTRGVGPVVVVDDHTSQHFVTTHNTDGVEAAPVSVLVDLLGNPRTDAFFLVVDKVGHGWIITHCGGVGQTISYGYPGWSVTSRSAWRYGSQRALVSAGISAN